MGGSGSGDPRRVVLAALSGNVAIAIAKIVAAAMSGSVAMLAEGVHSLADSANQGLLLVGMILSKKADPSRYPFGRAKESYFWPFVVALMLFSMGGLFAIYEGVHRLRSPDHEPGSPIVPFVVLALSILFESGSFLVAFREFNKQRGARTIRKALFQAKDPTISVVLLEDAAALAGLLIALIAVTTSFVTHSVVADGIGSLAIGVLLCAVGVALAIDTHSLLIGEAASPEQCRRALAAAEGTEGVEHVNQILTMHLGPDTIVLALKVGFRRGMAVEEVESVTNRIEERVRAAVPEMKKIFVEPDSRYDETLDPERRTAHSGAATMP